MPTSQPTEVTRIIHATRREVARAFSDPRDLEDWLFRDAETAGVRVLELGARPGGLFRVRYRRQTERQPIERHYVAFGAFTEHSADALTLEWSVLQLYPLLGATSVARHRDRITLDELDAHTGVHVWSETLGDAPELPRWGAWLDALEQLLTQQRVVTPARRAAQVA